MRGPVAVEFSGAVRDRLQAASRQYRQRPKHCEPDEEGNIHDNPPFGIGPNFERCFLWQMVSLLVRGSNDPDTRTAAAILALRERSFIISSVNDSVDLAVMGPAGAELFAERGRGKRRIIRRFDTGRARKPRARRRPAIRSDMKTEYHRWYSHRLGLDMGIVVYGHWGSPLMGFPTSAGDEWELDRQGMIGALAPLIEAGRVKFFSVNSVNWAGLYNKSAHPFHRSYMQSQLHGYIREEVVPFIWDSCKSPGIGISTMGASLGAYPAPNCLLKTRTVNNASCPLTCF